MRRPSDRLTDRERELLAWVREGRTVQSFAREHHYSVSWGRWISGQIRRKLGTATIEEAGRLSEVTAEDLAAIRKEMRELREAQEELAKAKTPATKAAAREDVQEARESLDDELRKRGLSKKDLDELEETKAYERHKARDERLAAEKAASAKPALNGAADEDEGDDEDGEPEEKEPESSHWTERPLFGRRK